MRYVHTTTKPTKKDRRHSGRTLFEGDYYDEYGQKIHYTITQWDNWNDYRDGFRNPIGHQYMFNQHPPSWKHSSKKRKQYHKAKLKKYKGWQS